ncbi:MAG: DUF1501 domain-containing protein [Verrucomicrobiales bacterium]
MDLYGDHGAVETAIQNYETAYRMQSAVPELMSIEGESDATRKLRGSIQISPRLRLSGVRSVARRLVERGVRFIELICPGGSGDRRDQHSRLSRGTPRTAAPSTSRSRAC